MGGRRSRQRKGWTRHRGGVFGVWEHVSGWRVYHCGHPTALWPYYALPPGVSPTACSVGQMLLSGGFGLGHAFQKLVMAQEAVEEAAREGKRP